MKQIVFPFRAETDFGAQNAIMTRCRLAQDRVSRRRDGCAQRSQRLRCLTTLLVVTILLVPTAFSPASAIAATRPHYGGLLRILFQSSPQTLELNDHSSPTEDWELSHALSLVGDTLVFVDVQGRTHAALATSWRNDGSGRHWEFMLRPAVKFHDGSVASPAAVAQVLGKLHPDWNVRCASGSSGETLVIETPSPMPQLLAELAETRNLILRRNANQWPVGTGGFLVSEWQPGKTLRLVANEASWASRPFIDAIEIGFGKSLRDQAIAFELGKVDLIETTPQSASGSEKQNTSLPIELLALVFTPGSKAQDANVRQALALAIDRKPINSVLLKGAAEPAATVLPNWMSGYTAMFSTQADPQRARALLGNSNLPELNLSYDPNDPRAQLIAERIALNTREAGINIQVSLSAKEDIRLTRIVLQSPDPATSLVAAAAELGLPKPALDTGSVEDLYHAERALLDGFTVIPLFHLPIAVAVSDRVEDWQPDPFGDWGDSAHGLASAWVADRANDKAANGSSFGSSLVASPSSSPSFVREAAPR
jgi:peptide/nickel transport system substrate-binding protein